jgi:Na+-driven multidrug efflux pump
LAFGLVLLLNLTQSWIFPIFTRNPETLALIGSLLLVSIVMESGRTFNVILIPALKGSGDVNFPVVVGIVFMWGVGVLGSWSLGVLAGWGLLGVWCAMAADETLRGVIMIARWRSGRWMGKSFVSSPATVALQAVTPASEEE